MPVAVPAPLMLWYALVVPDRADMVRQQVAREECRQRPDDEEILVCGRRRSAYAVPDTAGTFDPRGPKESVARERSRWAEEGDSGIQSCSSVGPGGWTGCPLKQWRKERQQEGYYQ